MKNRILSGWTFMRGFQLIIGCIVIIQSITEKQWLGILFGAYFAAMGLFAFGCASGNCRVPVRTKSATAIQDVDFEEVKAK
jgi:hypothetical protein